MYAMTRNEIEMACGQTPCLCGDIETWHPACYAGKSEAEVKSGYVRAYQIARVKLRTRANQHVARALYSEHHAQAAATAAASIISNAARRLRK